MNRARERGWGGEGGSNSARRSARAFTLLELLVVISILAALMAILLPAMSACRGAARNLKCMTQLRSVTFEFRAFVDDFAQQRGKGDPGAPGPPLQSLRIEDFQESLYRVDEYWDVPESTKSVFNPSSELLICPAGPSRLERRAEAPCSAGAVYPKANVSLAFNMRLHRATEVVGGRPVLRLQTLTSRILDYPDVPLALDVNGLAADAAFQLPYYIAPPTSASDNFSSGTYWFPSFRHGGRLNVGLVGGAVQSSRNPAGEPGWKWNYQPGVN